MQLEISIRHGHLSDASQEKIRTKAEKLGRFFERLTSIEIVVDLKDESQPRVDIMVSAEHKHDFVAHDQSDNLMKSFESSLQKVEQQLRKYKERLQSKNRNQQSRRLEPSPVDSEPVENEGDEE